MAGSIAAERRTGHDSDGDHRQNDRGRTPAQWYCYLAGAALLLAGIFGFLADSTFDTGKGGDASGNANGMLQGNGFLGFEVNGWHNLVHILSGLFLLAMAGKRRTAKPAALAFGIVYGIVALIGLIDGNDVLGIIPVNAADNVLHVALSLLGIVAGLISDRRDHRDHDRVATGTGRVRTHDVGTSTVGADRTVTEHDGAVAERAGGGRMLEPEDHNRTAQHQR